MLSSQTLHACVSAGKSRDVCGYLGEASPGPVWAREREWEQRCDRICCQMQSCDERACSQPARTAPAMACWHDGSSFASRGSGVQIPSAPQSKALTRKNAGQGLTFIYAVLNHPPKTPHKRVGATAFVGG